MLLGLLLSQFAFGQSTQRQIVNHQLAAYHAPVLFQEISNNPRTDAITRFDFDGDWIANNNWVNLNSYPTPAYVYYDLTETQTHYFILYAFFHPRDSARFCFWWQCHENDLEGVYVTVKKLPHKPMGEVVATATIAHSDIYLDTKPRMIDMSATEFFEKKSNIALRIEGGGHGVYTWDGKGNASNRLIYRYNAKAEDPKGARSGIYSYDLLHVDELWKNRESVGRGKTYINTYFHQGARYSVGEVPYGFAGEKYGSGMAHLPWGWHDSEDTQTRMGDWYFDTALTMFFRLKNPDNFSLDYVYNPHIGITD
jgi:hypothetical protein